MLQVLYANISKILILTFFRQSCNHKLLLYCVALLIWFYFSHFIAHCDAGSVSSFHIMYVYFNITNKLCFFMLIQLLLLQSLDLWLIFPFGFIQSFTQCTEKERERIKKNCKKSRTLREVNCCDIHNKGRSSIHSVKYRLTYESDPFFPMSILFTNWTPKKWRQKRTLHSFRDGFFVTFDKRQKATALNDVFGAILRMPDYILYILTIIFHQG